MTKSRLLPETDLALIALLPDDKKRTALEKVKLGYVPYSYTPFRKTIASIFGAKKPLIDLPKNTWEEIEGAIKRCCGKNLHWIDPNLKIATALHTFIEETSPKAFEGEFSPLPIGYGAKVRFWDNFYFDKDGLPTIAYMDARKNGLTKEARRFVFSIMQHHLAVGDFSEANFQIFRFPITEDKRKVEVFEFDNSDLLSLNEINAAIDKTYKLWMEVLEGREEETRQKATGTFGSLI